MSDLKKGPSRREFLSAAAGSLVAAATPIPLARASNLNSGQIDEVEEFYGLHQSGILTKPQAQTYFATFDVQTTNRDDLIQVLKQWTYESARMMAGSPSQTEESSEALDLSPSRLTLTFGFGSTLFADKDGHDRFAIAAQRPKGLVPMPKFNGDQLIESDCGGDLSVQACSDDLQVAFHAVRRLAKVAEGKLNLRWTQTGHLPQPKGGKTPRNLLGFKDGTVNAQDHDQFVWCGDQAPEWLRGGSFQVVRKIRMAIEHWDKMATPDQEQIIGRKKISGAPLSGEAETDASNFDAKDSDGNQVIPEDAHIRLASAQANAGAQILRRGYSYNNGTNVTAERWPPWHQGLEYDAGLLFVSYQSEMKNFIRIFQNLARFDALNQFTTHVGGGFFACPPGVTKQGEFIGQKLF